MHSSTPPAILVLALILVGCGGMTNDQIIAEIKKCHDAGMGYGEVMNNWTYETTKIICRGRAP